MMIFCIIGRARAGKTTASNILSDISGLKTESTSNTLYELASIYYNIPLEELKRKPKEELRPMFIEAGDYLCDIYPCILSEGLLKSGYNIIDGIRRDIELNTLKKLYKFKVILIKRDSSLDDNFNISDDQADYIIDNNHTIEELKINLIKIYNENN